MVWVSACSASRTASTSPARDHGLRSRGAPRSYGRDPGDAEYAARLLRSARDLYSAANAHLGSFAARYHYQCTSRFNRARLGARNVARLAANATCVPPAQARPRRALRADMHEAAFPAAASRLRVGLS